MSTTLEAETDIAAAEAAAAIEAEEAAAVAAHEDAALAARADELEAAAAAGRFDDSAGITAEKDAGEAASLTQAEREATAEHDGAPAEPAKTKRRSRSKKDDTPAQGTFEGAWEKVIGGSLPNEKKIKISGGACQPSNAPDTILVESRHRIVIDVVAVEHKTRAKLDKATGEVSNTGLTNTLEIVGATFLDPDEYITRDEEEPDAPAEPEAEEPAT